MSTKAKPVKWTLVLWPERPVYDGKTRRVFRRDYPQLSSAVRALAAVSRNHPEARCAEITCFTNEGWCWLMDENRSQVFYRCPHGDGWLQWREDQWICPRCGDEWTDEVIRPWTTKAATT